MSDAERGQSVPATTYDQLAARFAASDHKTKTLGGTSLTYVDGETVVSRLNQVLGFDGWAFEVKDVKVLEDEVWAMGRLTVYSGDRAIVREQAGGQIINRKRGIPARPYVPADGDRPEQPAMPAQKGEVVELNNDIKGAITDCLKKCATLVGVGLYLYDPAERREVESEMRQSRNTTPSAAPAPKAPVSTTTTRPTAAPSNVAAQAVAPDVDAAAKLTGAPPQPINAARCQQCGTDVPRDGSVTILKKKGGEKVTVSVADFEPVCKERLGSFHCAGCYERKWFGAA